jgi:aminoglycoside phosphotransferase (APT) family kinase protein
MKKKEILRLVQLCLPKLSSDGDDNNEQQTCHIHDESDIHVSSICSLWSGMGHIYKVQLPASSTPAASVAAAAAASGGRQQAAKKATTLVIKHVAAPRSNKDLSFGDRRKADSYQVEANFYDKLATRLLMIQQHPLCRVPSPYLVLRDAGKGKNEIVICMSYVESNAKDVVSDDDEAVQAVLTWLASFHAAYWGSVAVDAIVDETGMQKQGSYWHLDTRPDEHAAMPSTGWQGRLKRASKAIDGHLKNNDKMQCLIHGDAKDANVLYTRNVNTKKLQVTMCDFQYVGKGPPTKDLAYYFISSVSPENEDRALEFYLRELTQRLNAKKSASASTSTTSAAPPPPPTMHELKASMDLAYCDFYRFMCGWGFWGADGNTGQERVKRILDRLDGGKDLGSEEAYEEAVRREYG